MLSQILLVYLLEVAKNENANFSHTSGFRSWVVDLKRTPNTRETVIYYLIVFVDIYIIESTKHFKLKQQLDLISISALGLPMWFHNYLSI